MDSSKFSAKFESPLRYHDLDALRAVAMLLGIGLHGLLSFIETPIWPAQDRYQHSKTYAFVLHAIHGFRMPLFFLISGFFAAMLWRRRGTRGLLKHRAQRILLPLLLGTLLLWPMMVELAEWGGSNNEKIVALRLGGDGDDDGARAATIWAAAKYGDLEAIDSHLDNGADLNAGEPNSGIPPLEWAVLAGHVDAMELLIERGAMVDVTDWQGSTPLHAGAFLGRADAVELLLASGASPNMKNNEGETPLDSQAHGWGVVQWICGMVGIEVERDEVMEGREQTGAMLRKAGGTTTSAEGGDQEPGLRGLIGLWTLGAMFPVFHHLWFLYYLCLLLAIFVVAASVTRWAGARVPDVLVSSPLRWLWLLPLTLLAQLFMFQSFGPDTAPGVLPWPPKLAYYAIFFGFGALCFGKPFFEKGAGRRWWLWLLLSVPVLLVGVHAFDRRGEDFLSLHILSSCCAVLYAWMMIFACIGFFRRFFHTESPRIRYTSDSAYWLYLAHLPVIIAVQILVSGWDFPALAKLVFVCVSTTGLLLLIYEYGVRYSWIGTMLNGRKHRHKHGDPARQSVRLSKSGSLVATSMALGLSGWVNSSAHADPPTEAQKPTLSTGATESAPASEVTTTVSAEEEETSPYLTRAVSADHFRDLKENSPFQRVLNFEATYTLSAVAEVDSEAVVLLYDRETKKTVTVRETEANELGMRVVSVTRDRKDLKGVSVRLTIGGEDFEFGYTAEQVAPKAKPVKDDGQGRAIPPQRIIAKFKTMNREQMARYQAWRADMVKKNPEMDKSPKRFPVIEKAIDAVLSGQAPRRY